MTKLFDDGCVFGSGKVGKGAMLGEVAGIYEVNEEDIDLKKDIGI